MEQTPNVHLCYRMPQCKNFIKSCKGCFFLTDSTPVPKLCGTCYNEYDGSLSDLAVPHACCWCTDDALLRTYNITLHVASPGNKWAISLPVVKLITLNCQSWFNNTYLLSVRHLGQDSWFLHQTGLHARALALFIVESLWYSVIVVPYVVNIFPNTQMLQTWIFTLQ